MLLQLATRTHSSTPPGMPSPIAASSTEWAMSSLPKLAESGQQRAHQRRASLPNALAPPHVQPEQPVASATAERWVSAPTPTTTHAISPPGTTGGSSETSAPPSRRSNGHGNLFRAWLFPPPPQLLPTSGAEHVGSLLQHWLYAPPTTTIPAPGEGEGEGAMRAEFASPMGVPATPPTTPTTPSAGIVARRASAPLTTTTSSGGEVSSIMAAAGPALTARRFSAAGTSSGVSPPSLFSSSESPSEEAEHAGSTAAETTTPLQQTGRLASRRRAQQGREWVKSGVRGETTTTATAGVGAEGVVSPQGETTTTRPLGAQKAKKGSGRRAGGGRQGTAQQQQPRVGGEEAEPTRVLVVEDNPIGMRVWCSLRLSCG